MVKFIWQLQASCNCDIYISIKDIFKMSQCLGLVWELKKLCQNILFKILQGIVTRIASNAYTSSEKIQF